MWSADHISKDFVKIVLGWDINEFCLKYEAFALFRLKGEYVVSHVCARMSLMAAVAALGIAMNNNDRVIFTRCRIRTLVKCGLRQSISCY